MGMDLLDIVKLWRKLEQVFSHAPRLQPYRDEMFRLRIDERRRRHCRKSQLIKKEWRMEAGCKEGDQPASS